MQLCLLHLDNALEQQEEFIKTCEQSNAQHVNVKHEGSIVRLWGKQAALDDLKQKISSSLLELGDKPKLCFMGSGDFHHISSLLIGSLVEKQDEPITVIHFDNHPDWVHFSGGTHCGSWVNRALDLPQVQKVITVGVCSDDLYLPELKGANLSLLSKGKLELFPYYHAPSRVRKQYGTGASYKQEKSHLVWNNIQQIGDDEFIKLLLSRIKTKSVYITLDKDVLLHEDAITNWDQGMMRLPYLLEIVRKIGEEHKIIGADVNGDYSVPHYSGSLITRFKKHAEIFMDQPRDRKDISATSKLNSATNHAVLKLFSDVMEKEKGKIYFGGLNINGISKSKNTVGNWILHHYRSGT